MGLEITFFYQNIFFKQNAACPAIFWHTTCDTHANGPVLFGHQIPGQNSNEKSPGSEIEIQL
jgi:hypothetical protein